MIQLAWRFLMFQKESALAECYRQRTANAPSTRKTLVVALARNCLLRSGASRAKLTNQLKVEQLRDFEAAKIIDQEALSVARRLTTSLPAWRMTTTALGS
jgi:hypothetical protein